LNIFITKTSLKFVDLSYGRKIPLDLLRQEQNQLYLP
jgi:hypothetical protein